LFVYEHFEKITPSSDSETGATDELKAAEQVAASLAPKLSEPKPSEFICLFVCLCLVLPVFFKAFRRQIASLLVLRVPEEAVAEEAGLLEAPSRMWEDGLWRIPS
jgi:hypothetical protein